MISQSTRKKLEESVELSVSSAETGLEYVRGYVAEWLATFATAGEKVEALREINMLLEIVQRRVEHAQKPDRPADTVWRQIQRGDAVVGEILHLVVKRRGGVTSWDGVTLVAWSEKYLHVETHTGQPLMFSTDRIVSVHAVRPRSEYETA